MPRGWGMMGDHFCSLFFFSGLVVGGWQWGHFSGFEEFFSCFCFQREGDRSRPGFGSEERFLFMLFEAALLVVSHDEAAHITMEHPKKTL